VGWLGERRERHDERLHARRKEQWWKDVKEMAAELGDTSPVQLMQRTDVTIDRLAELLAAADARAPRLTEQQKAKSTDPGYLDRLVQSEGEPPAEYLCDPVEIRRIGHLLYKEGGDIWTMIVVSRAMDLHHITQRDVSKRWDGIGNWRG
jgi:hypothetical protein